MADKECPCQEFNEMFRLLMEGLNQDHELDIRIEKCLDSITDKAAKPAEKPPT